MRLYLEGEGVRNSADLRRVAALPRRVWTSDTAEPLAARMTALLRTPNGTMSLRPVQAQALHDAGVCGGGFFPIRVGGGKTLLSVLVPYVMGAQRPILLIPASLREKTKREMRELSRHWRIPYARIRVESYEQLSQPGSQNMLAVYRPDLIVCDEVHRLKNHRAAVTRRVSKYMREQPATGFVGMSGTVTKRSLRDYAHVLSWCLKSGAPVPSEWPAVEEWAQALDEKTQSVVRMHPGALLSFATPEDIAQGEGDDTRTARLAVRRRVTETPGVVATTEGFEGASIYVTADVLPRSEFSAVMEGAFARLRGEATTPDDWPLTDAMSLWRHARELALGFYYRWDPRPPPEWLLARKAWAAVIRDILKHNPLGLDSEFLVASAVADGRYRPPGAHDAYLLWKEVEPIFNPNTVPVWLDDTEIKRTTAWLRKHPRGIAWVEHTAFGRRLSEVSGVPYFGRNGEDAAGRTIESYADKGPVIASVSSNATGRNLQAWHDNYLVSCPPGGALWEQLLGRTHREGQTADAVTVTVNVSCIEHYDAIGRALSDARYIEDTTGQAQKILYADLAIPDPRDIQGLPSRRFQR